MKDWKFEEEEEKLIKILSKGVHILHPEVIQHLIKPISDELK